MYRLAAFDMDGTLIDTAALITEHMATTFTHAGLEPPTPEQSRRVIGLLATGDAGFAGQ